MRQMDVWVKQIEPFIIEADNFYNSTGGNRATSLNTWKQNVATLKSQVVFARNQP